VGIQNRAPAPANEWGAWRRGVWAGGVLRGPAREARAGRGGVSHGPPAPIVRPGGGGGGGGAER
jgi:hypothetical protein